MCKVGIMSMQRIANYGSFLQAYGLKKIVEQLGHEVCFVDYHVGDILVQDENATQSRQLRNLRKMREVLFYRASFKQKIQYIFYKKNFEKNYFPLLGLASDKNYNSKLDVLIIGSDEVFNCTQKNTNVGYSLELFGKNSRASRLISYAASFGNTTKEKLEKYGKWAEIAECIHKFDAVSVRDENSAQIIEAMTGRYPECHLDPVLIFDYMQDCKNISKLDSIKEKFLIVYAYSGRISIEEAKTIKHYADERSLKIYSIGGVQPYADRFIDCTPFEVLAYFRQAECVVTDTFHGSIFSIITETAFVSLVRKTEENSYGNEEKLADLLKKLHLEERMIWDSKEIGQVLEQEISFEECNRIIEHERIMTQKYLQLHLEKVGL